jgi:hypothetical protein
MENKRREFRPSEHVPLTREAMGAHVKGYETQESLWKREEDLFFAEKMSEKSSSAREKLPFRDIVI